MLSRVRNPGPDYLAHLQWIHEHVRPSVYLEIGVFKGDSIRLATADCRVIGVDPQRLIAATDSLTLFATTSDDFFTNGAADRVLRPHGFDFAFIDGEHLFEQIFRDFVHIEQYAAAGALLALHDTLPLDEMTSARTRRTTFYSGDSWKLLAVLRDLRPDLRVQSIPTAPTGLTIVEGLSPTSDILARRYDEVVKGYSSMSWHDYLAERHNMSNAVANTLGVLQNLHQGITCLQTASRPPLLQLEMTNGPNRVIGDISLRDGWIVTGWVLVPAPAHVDVGGRPHRSTPCRIRGCDHVDGWGNERGIRPPGIRLRAAFSVGARDRPSVGMLRPGRHAHRPALDHVAASQTLQQSL